VCCSRCPSQALKIQPKPPLCSAADAAAAQVVGSKRQTGNDLFREKLMASSSAAAAAAASEQGPSHPKRQALDLHEGECDASDWLELTTHQHHTYFMHVPTGRGQWNRPALLADVQDAAGVHDVGCGGGVASAQGEAQGGGADCPATCVAAPCSFSVIL
jgi:hypothetical protein